MERLKNLELSEVCLRSIQTLVEEYLNEKKMDGWEPPKKRIPSSHTVGRYGTEKLEDDLQLKIDFNTNPNKEDNNEEDDGNK